MNREFKPGKDSKLVINLTLLFLWISLPLTAYVFCASILSLIVGQGILSRALVAILISIYAFYVAIRISLPIINEYDQIRLTKEGLYVRVYTFRYYWKLVEWHDVLGIKLSPSLDRWKMPVWVISVRRLTYWHKLLSSQYGCGSQPGIIISSDLIDRDELLKVVENRLRKS